MTKQRQKSESRTQKSPSTDKETKLMSAGNGHRPVKFQIQMQTPVQSQIFVAGTFNDWNPSAVPLRHNGNNVYSTDLELTPGRYEYKFVIDGEWLLDSANPAWAPNNMGSLNSVIEVPEKGSGDVGHRSN